MGRNFNLELQLLPPYSGDHLSSEYTSPYHQYPNPKEEQQQQQLTIFYNGKMAVADVTDLQAREIIMLARRENEEKSKIPCGSNPPSASPMIQSQQIYGPTALSMKKSLQRFLQKRKNRMQAASPYHH